MIDKDAALTGIANHLEAVAQDLRELLPLTVPVEEPVEDPIEDPIEDPVEDPVEDPAAKLVARFTHKANGLTVEFDRTSSTRPEENGLVTKWNFGDKTTGAGAQPEHTYGAPGTYDVTLELSHNLFPDLGKSIVTKQITVLGVALPPDPDDEEEEEIPPVKPPPGPVPSPTPQGTPNEPSGYRIISDRLFRTKHPAYGSSSQQYPNPADLPLAEGWSSIEGKYGGFTIVDDSTAPSGDGKVGQMKYPAGMRSGVGPASAIIQFPLGLTEAYIAIWMKLSKNLIGNKSKTNKMFFVGIAGGNNQFFLSAEGVGVGALMPQVRLQGIVDARPRILPNVKQALINRGMWQLFEFVLKGNSGLSKADGMIDMYIDKAHTTHVDKVNWTQSKHLDRPFNVNQINWNPTYGGGGPGVPFNSKDYQWNPADATTHTRSREYILAMSKLPPNQRPQKEPEIDYTSPAPEFAIDPNDEAQYQWFDRVYVSAK